MSLSRRKSRILVMEALFSWEISRQPLEELLQFCWLDKEVNATCAETDFAFPRLLLSGVLENIVAIDAKITEYLRGWEFERINGIDKAILRMSVYSLLFQKDIAASIVIDEAVSIAHDYGDDDSYKFVNGILDAIRKNEAFEK
jgi:transcription antitermination factor nusB